MILLSIVKSICIVIMVLIVSLLSGMFAVQREVSGKIWVGNNGKYFAEGRQQGMGCVQGG